MVHVGAGAAMLPLAYALDAAAQMQDVGAQLVAAEAAAQALANQATKPASHSSSAEDGVAAYLLPPALSPLVPVTSPDPGTAQAVFTNTTLMGLVGAACTGGDGGQNVKVKPLAPQPPISPSGGKPANPAGQRSTPDTDAQGVCPFGG